MGGEPRDAAAPPLRSFLIVDDDAAYTAKLARAFVRHGYEMPGIAYSYPDALELAANHHYDRAVVDMRLGDGPTGFDVVRDLVRRFSGLRAIMITNYPSLEALRIATSVGAIDLIRKTDDVPHILHAFARPDRNYVDTSRLTLIPPSLAQLEWEHLNQVLTLTAGNATDAAMILGISRSTLYRKLDRRPASEWSAAAHQAFESRARRRKPAAKKTKTKTKTKRKVARKGTRPRTR